MKTKKEKLSIIKIETNDDFFDKISNLLRERSEIDDRNPADGLKDGESEIIITAAKFTGESKKGSLSNKRCMTLLGRSSGQSFEQFMDMIKEVYDKQDYGYKGRGNSGRMVAPSIENLSSEDREQFERLLRKLFNRNNGN